MTAPEKRLAELLAAPDPTPEQEAAGSDRLIAELRDQAPWTALWRKRARLVFTAAELEAYGRAGDLMNLAGAEGLRSSAPTEADTTRKDGGHEQYP